MPKRDFYVMNSRKEIAQYMQTRYLNVVEIYTISFEPTLFAWQAEKFLSIFGLKIKIQKK